MPEIETLGHRLGKHGIRLETSETGDLWLFPQGLTEEWGPELSTPALEIGKPPFSFSTPKVALKDFRKQNPHRTIRNNLIAWPLAKVVKFCQGNDTSESEQQVPPCRRSARISG